MDRNAVITNMTVWMCSACSCMLFACMISDMDFDS